MSRNLIRETIRGDATWTCPAGVKSLRIAIVRSLGFQVSHGSSFAHAIAADGRLYGQGLNANGQLGVGDVVDRSIPILVVGGVIWRMVSSGASSTSNHVIGVDLAGAAYAFGINTNGQLGDGTTTPRSSPVLVSGGIVARKAIAGEQSSAMVSRDGLLYTWGRNNAGQLGDGTVASRSTPNLTADLSAQWRDVAMGGAHTVALSYDGSIYSWGLNTNGQLGNGNVTARSSPVLVAFSKKFKSISAGASNSVGVTEDGDAYAWGNNTTGSCGDGTVIPKSTPTLVIGSHKWKSVRVGNGYMIGVTTEGAAYAWGANPDGRLGVGDTAARSTPTLVVGGSLWSDIAPGGNDTTGITAGGQQQGWGSNVNGALGVGNVTPTSSPVLVSSSFRWNSMLGGILVEDVVAVVPGTSYSLALFAEIVRLGSYGLYADEPASGCMPITAVLEYQG